MKCPVCYEEFLEGDRIVYNKKETFVFKPAHVRDTVNPAEVTQQELLESRKEHLRTTIATVYSEFGTRPIPEYAFGVRHAACNVGRTGESSSLHPVTKHRIRYSRKIARRMH